jgi:hypothetical protein
MGLDPDVWFGQVELAAAKTVGDETVDYVRNIFKYYIAYTLVRDQLLSAKQTATSARPGGFTVPPGTVSGSHRQRVRGAG